MISAIIPCYNQAKYLPEAVESIVDQTYDDWEIHIINDSSTDNSGEVASNLISEHKDKRIYLHVTPDVGGTNARAYEIRKSKGDYYLPLDADDKIDLQYFESALPILEQNNNLGFVYVQSTYFDKQKTWSVPSPEYNFSIDKGQQQASS